MHTVKGTQNSEPIKVKAKGIKVYKEEETEYSFKLPYLLAKGPHNEIIVGNNEEGIHHLVVFDENLQFLKTIGSEGQGDGKFRFVRGIALDKEGCLYVTDGYLHCIQKFTLDDGKFHSQFGKEGRKNGEFNGPAGLLISKSNLLFVCDRMNHRIQVFREGEYLFKIGESADYKNLGYFNEPVDLTFNNSETELFVTDWRNDKIKTFTPLGVPLKAVDFPSGLRLQHPNGIHFTSDGRLLVSALNYVYIFKDNTWSAIKPIVSDSQSQINNIGDYIGVLMMDNGNILITDGVLGNDQLILIPNKLVSYV